MMKLDIKEGSNTKSFEQNIESEMDKHIKHLEKELLKLRTGRAHSSMIEDIKINSYGAMTPLKNIAAISAPDVTLLVIQPWDKALMPDIEKAISSSDLGVTPLNDGNIIRIQMPKMSAGRRDEVVKILNKKIEDAKQSIRNVRKDAQNIVREMEKDKKISEDYSRRLQDVLQKSTDKFIVLSDKIKTKKEEEVRLL